MTKLAICPYGTENPECKHRVEGRYCNSVPYKSVVEKHDGSVWVEECGLSYEERCAAVSL